MHSSELIELSRNVEASIVPSGDKVTLQKGEQAQNHSDSRRHLHRYN